MNKKFLLPFISIPLIFIIIYLAPQTEKTEIIKGANLVAPDEKFEASKLKPLLETGFNWVAVVPYAYCRDKDPELHWNEPWQWWGEKAEGAIETIQMAKEKNLKVLLKPHVWVVGQGWPGNYTLESEQQWLEWESSYHSFIMEFAQIADSLQVDMFCVGTEYRIAANSRPEFWRQLIKEIRKVYKGPVTYASNWDNYHNITFWDQLDLIGIDAYWPLSDKRIPVKEELVQSWKTIEKELITFSDKENKRILFTEYGFRSRDFNTKEPWLTSHSETRVNLENQKTAFEAFYEFFNEKVWYAGGFLWKWHPDHQNVGGSNCSRFTPQNKPAQQVIKYWNLKDKNENR